jgi:primosomal protein N' (replication factor Y) (superfamily II helicase)
VSGRASQTARKRGAPRRAPQQATAELPVARLAVDISLPHLDRPFDYLVPVALGAQAVPGSQVRVRFAGQLVSGFVLARLADSDHPGRLGFLERVVAPEPVLTPEIAELARAVADRYGGTLADVLRLAIPPRHAAASKARLGQVVAGTPVPIDGQLASDDGRDVSANGPAARVGTEPTTADGADGYWARYRDGASFLAALENGRSPRAVWSALPGPTWPDEIAQAIAAVARSGRGAVVVVPDARDLALVDVALGAQLAPARHVVLSASLGAAERYRRWLAVARGEVKVVAGTRSAMFAPVADLGLVVLWDDGDDLHAEPRAPYPHAREVLALRAYLAQSGALIGGFARTAEAALLVSSSWARSLAADRAVVRQCAPAIQSAGGEAELARDEAARSARLPSIALRTARAVLGDGPVLVQVPRRGYLAAVACERCHARARCTCGGPAELPGPQAPLRCGWCGSAIGRACRQCGHEGLRAVMTGARRTAEELGRAFSPLPVLTSGGSQVLDRVGREPAVVVATPGAEPVADDGYRAAILLDGWAMLGVASLRAAEEALRRWLNAAALVRPAADGGRVVIVADGSQPAVQALIRWDPVTFAARELAERDELRFPPAARMASVAGPADAVDALLALAELPTDAEVLGPLPTMSGPTARALARTGHAGDDVPDAVRYLVRVSRSEGTELALALRAAQAVRTAAKEPGAVRVQLDPAALI